MKFAFLVHPRDINDVYKKYPFFKIFPSSFIKYTLKKLSPIVVSKIYGLNSRNTGIPADGLLVSIGMTAKDMLADRETAKEEVIKALEFSKKKGAKIIGLGALTSPIVNGGSDLVGKHGVLITNGNTLTVSMAFTGIKKLIDKNTTIGKNFTVAIVGATGSIGSAVSVLVAKCDKVNTLVIIGRNSEKLQRLENDLCKSGVGKNGILTHIIKTTEISDLKNSDLVVVATSADGAIIKGAYLKQNAIVYDITQPKNTSKALTEERPDVTVIDGGLVRLPENVGFRFDSGLPKNITFSCLAETMILAAEDAEQNFSIGDVKVDNVETISNLAKVYNIEAAPFLNIR